MSKDQIEEMAKAFYDIVKARRGKASMCDFATDLYTAGYRKPEWISVDDRLPDKQAQFLIMDDKGYMEIALWTRQFGWFSHINRGNKVTHWMPLPEPPKMKGGAE